MEDRNRRYACDRCRGHKVRYTDFLPLTDYVYIDIHSCDASVDMVTHARVSGV